MYCWVFYVFGTYSCQIQIIPCSLYYYRRVPPCPLFLIPSPMSSLSILSDQGFSFQCQCPSDRYPWASCHFVPHGNIKSMREVTVQVQFGIHWYIKFQLATRHRYNFHNLSGLFKNIVVIPHLSYLYITKYFHRQLYQPS